MRIVIILTYFICCFTTVYSQEICWNNDSIRYEIIHTTPSVISSKDEKKDLLSGYFIKMEIKKSTKQKLLCRDFSFWLDRLNNNKSDWSTNIILHYIYKREASIIKILENDREKWNSVKEKEIEYWKSFFELKGSNKGCD